MQSLIPDIKPSLGQEAVLDLHPEEMHLSGEEESGERGDQDLKIRRTVTQVCRFCCGFYNFALTTNTLHGIRSHLSNGVHLF